MTRIVQLISVCAMALAALAGPPVHADIYKKIDQFGHVHLTDRPKGSGWKLILRTKPYPDPASGGWPSKPTENEERFSPLINQVATELSIDAELVHAVIRAESSYNPEAVSRAGAVGLMQLMPGTAERYGVRDRRDPRANLYGGARYLRDLLEQFRRLELALAAYNAGENAVVRHGNRIPPYPETQTYVQRVMRFYKERQKNTSG